MEKKQQVNVAQPGERRGALAAISGHCCLPPAEHTALLSPSDIMIYKKAAPAGSC